MGADKSAENDPTFSAQSGISMKKGFIVRSWSVLLNIRDIFFFYIWELLCSVYWLNKSSHWGINETQNQWMQRYQPDGVYTWKLYVPNFDLFLSDDC